MLLGLYAIVLAAAAFSAIDMGLFLKRVWFGHPAVQRHHHHPVDLPRSAASTRSSAFRLASSTCGRRRKGCSRPASSCSRVGVSVSVAILLILTTRWADILKSLHVLRVPSVFILVLAMTYRYIFLFLHTANGMFLARKSRMVARTTGGEQRWWIVSTIGVLMSRSFRMSEEVYQAMLRARLH